MTPLAKEQTSEQPHPTSPIREECREEYPDKRTSSVPLIGGNKRGVDYISYNSSFTEYARQNRKYPTKAEGIFWHCVVKNKLLLGYKFRRQKVVGSFILDFYCPKLLMGIELDGGYHNDRIEYDRVRDAKIYKLGIRVIRFTNEDIQKNLSGVIRELHQIIKEREEMLLQIN